MDNYLLGNLIREYRERAEISREELAGDFCAVSTLMRIESGEEIPGRALANELCSTLGLIPPATKRETTSRADIDRYLIERKIKIKLSQKKYDYDDLLKKYAECEMNVYEQQIHDYYAALALLKNKASPEKLYELLSSSLALTLFSRTEKFLPLRRLLSKMELLLIRQLSLAQYKLGMKDDALAIMNYLDKFFERGICIEEVSKMEYPQVLRFLSEWNLERGENERVVSIAERGFPECLKSSLLYPFVHIFQARATALSLLNSEDAQIENKMADMLVAMSENAIRKNEIE